MPRQQECDGVGLAGIEVEIDRRGAGRVLIPADTFYFYV